MRKTKYSATAAILLGMAASISIAISGCNQERSTQSTQEGSWSIAPRVLAGDLTVNEMSQATWVRVEATRDGQVVAYVDSPFSARSAVLRVPDPGAVVVAVSGYEDKGRTTMLWTGSANVETGTANPTVPLARGPGLTPLPKPRFSADSGTFRNGLKLGIAADSSGIEIHYTTDGGDPTANSPKYTDSLAVDRSMVVSAVAYRKGRALSDIARAVIKVKRDTLPAPKVSEGAGEYARILQVALTCDTAGAVIKYTTDGRDPDDSSATYTTPIEVAKSMKIRAFAKKSGLTSSDVRTFEYTINLPALAKPTFKPAGGRFDSAQDVVLTADSGAIIHYTTVQGVVPTERDSVYRAPIRVATTTTISAIAVKVGKSASPVASETYSIVPPGTTASPWFEPAGAVYKSAQTVRIKADSGAVVHCTLNDGDPDATSPVCADSFRVESRTTIKAIAILPGKKSSDVFTAVYDIRPDTVPAPRMSPEGGVAYVYEAGQNVTITSDSASADIHYTLDGKEPSAQSTKYAGPVVLDSNTTIRAIATMKGLANSAIVTASYTVRKKGALPDPVINPGGGIFQDSQIVTITCDTGDAEIHYTTDGSAPTANSPKYTGAFMVKSTQQIQAVATKAGSPSSEIASAWITIQVVGQAESPRISPNGGSFGAPQSVWLFTVSDTSLKIFYTTNDSTPTTASTLYDGQPIVVAKSTVVKAIAAKDGLTTSSVSTATFTIEEKILDTTGVPAISPDGGTFTDKVLVGLSSSTPEATIYYTLDGREPTEASLVYSDSIPVEATGTLKAFACAAGKACSRSDSAKFTVNFRPLVATPTLNPPGGTYNGSQSVVVKCATDSVVLRYTLDGNNPGETSSEVKGAIAINSSSKLKVVAYRTGWLPSEIGRGEYEIIPKTEAPKFSLDPKDTLHAPVNLALTSPTVGAAIYFTTDGSEPDSGSNLYKDSIYIKYEQTIKAIAYAPGMAASDVVSADYLYSEIGTVAMPVIGPNTPLFVGSVLVSITSAAGSTTWYTTDGTDPRTSSTRKAYTGAFTIAATSTVKAYSTMTGMTESSVRSVTYALTTQVATPVITPATGSYSTTQYATIGCATTGATIHYTLDGSAPTTSSSIYSGTAIPLSATTTVHAVAVASGQIPSTVASSAITILPQLGLPTFSVTPGTYTTILSVSLLPPVAGATMYYTTDGSTPTTASTKYVAAITVDTTTTIRAIAVMSGYSNSAPSKAAYTIDLPKLDTLKFNMLPGYYTGAQTILITPPVSTASIYYTTDGTDPTANSSMYTSRGIYLTKNATIKAIAVKTGFKPSDVSVKTYYIRCPVVPTLTPDSTDKVAGNKSITMKSSDPACPDIYYTINGATPNSTNGRPYTGPVTVSYDQTIRAVASGAGMYYSLQNVQGYNYVSRVLDVNAPAAVVFSVTSGTFALTQSVTMSSKGSTAIYYTDDWTEPTTASLKYTGPIKVTRTTTIKARAFNGTFAGPVSGANYIFK